jgi:hypothetical protein
VCFCNNIPYQLQEMKKSRIVGQDFEMHAGSIQGQNGDRRREYSTEPVSYHTLLCPLRN